MTTHQDMLKYTHLLLSTNLGQFNLKLKEPPTDIKGSVAHWNFMAMIEDGHYNNILLKDKLEKFDRFLNPSDMQALHQSIAGVPADSRLVISKAELK